MATLRNVVTVGGKGSSLSSASVHAIANGIAQVRIDSSVLEKLTPTLPLSKISLDIPNPNPNPNKPEFVTLEEARASLVVLLNKLVLTQTGIRNVLPQFISETLNRWFAIESLDFSSVNRFLDSFLRLNGRNFVDTGVTDGELHVLNNNSSYYLDGICALLDCSSSSLSVTADAVAAFSFEALNADVSMVNLVDSGDGLSNKDEIAVASDMKVLLVGSKLVSGRDQSDIAKDQSGSISDIPKVHGSFREVVRSVHSRTRVELNSIVKFGKAGSVESLVTAFLPLASSLRFLGELSFRRATLLAKYKHFDISSDRVLEMFEKGCPKFDSLRDGCRFALEYVSESNYLRFLQQIYNLVGNVREILAWEGALAFLALEILESEEKTSEVNVVPSRVEFGQGNANVEKKSQKKKKVVLGKGTAVIRQLIKDRLKNKGGDSVDRLVDWSRDLSLFFNPKDPELDDFLKKMKEIVESNDARRLPKIPKGTRDFAKEQMAIRERAFKIIEEVFKRHGAMALQTPVFEMRETLMGKYGEDSKLVYDLADQGGELCSLRYDLTIPFARYVAMNGLTSFKRYQIANVYRRDNPSKGRYREFYQCDFDIAGQYEAMGPDFEVVKVLTELLDEFNIGDYEVKLNHRKLLDAMLEICGVPAEKLKTICSSIDKLDKQSFEQIKKEMVEEKGLTAETADRIGDFVKKRGPPMEILSELKLEGQFVENKESVQAFKDLEILFNALDRSKCIHRVVFDLSLARGLDYYTGVIFEAVFKGTTQVGSIAAGGRYDDLIGMFGSKQVPSVGVSLGIERVFNIMEQQLEKDGNQSVRATETQVLVSIYGDDLSQAAELVSMLWSAKINAEYLVNKRVAKHTDRAKESRIPWMVIVGESEQKKGVVIIKDVETNNKEEVQRNRVVEELQTRLSSKNWNEVIKLRFRGE